MIKFFRKSALSQAVAVTSVSVGAIATNVQAAEVIEEVTVTATKRAASVQEIPYNISAVSGELLERTGITDMAALARNIPGVVFMDKGPRSAGAFANSIAMRGVNIDGSGNTSDRPGNTAPTVATYVGSVPMFTSIRLKDIERVEVLRGPQGTLYGSGAMGGIVRLVPRLPDPDETLVELSTRLSATDESDDWNNEFDFTFNAPISDTVALRGNISRVENAGFIDAPSLYEFDANNSPVLADPANPATSGAVTRSDDDVNDEEIINGRISALWNVSDSTSAVVTYHAQRDEVNGRQGDSDFLGEYEFGNRIEEPFERDVELLSLDLESDLGFATMTVAASRSETDGELVKDQSGSYGPEGNLGISLNFPGYFGSGIDLYTEYYGNNPRFAVESKREWQDEVSSLEVRLVSNTDGAPIDWLVGFSYLKQDFRLRQEDSNLGRNDYIAAVNDAGLTLIGLDGTPAVGPGFFTGTTPNNLGYFFDNDTEFTDLALFGELTYHISDAWQVTAGARYFDQSFDAAQEGGLLVSGFVVDNTADIEESDVLLKLNTSYDINDNTMLFATWSEGFRRGGVNAVPANLVRAARGESLEFEADEITSMELGLKGSLGEKIDYTVTAFDIDWDNPQLNTNLTFLALVGVANVPAAETRGFELEVSATPMDSLQLTFGYSYVDTEITESVEQADRLALVGSQLPVPKSTASIVVNYFQDLGNRGELIWSLLGSYKDETPSGTEATRGPNARRFQVFDSFTLLDATVSLEQGKWVASAFINNLTNERATSGGQTAAFSSPIGQWDAVVRPRTIGFGLRYNFID